MIHNFIHIQLRVINLDASIDFYTNVFGWNIKKLSPEFALIEISAKEEILNGSIRVTKNLERGNGTIPFVYTPDIDKSLALVEINGGEITYPKAKDGVYPGYSAVFKDPEGIRIALWSEMD